MRAPDSCPFQRRLRPGRRALLLQAPRPLPQDQPALAPHQSWPWPWPGARPRGRGERGVCSPAGDLSGASSCPTWQLMQGARPGRAEPGDGLQSSLRPGELCRLALTLLASFSSSEDTRGLWATVGRGDISGTSLHTLHFPSFRALCLTGPPGLVVEGESRNPL